MRRFIFETSDQTAADVAAALALAATRFPEVDVEHRYIGRGESRRELWVCTAPSEMHVARWAAAAAFPVAEIGQVDDVAPIAVQPAARAGEHPGGHPSERKQR